MESLVASLIFFGLLSVVVIITNSMKSNESDKNTWSNKNSSSPWNYVYVITRKDILTYVALFSVVLLALCGDNQWGTTASFINALHIILAFIVLSLLSMDLHFSFEKLAHSFASVFNLAAYVLAGVSTLEFIDDLEEDGVLAHARRGGARGHRSSASRSSSSSTNCR